METWGLLLDTETVRQLTDERRAKLSGQWGLGGTTAGRAGTARRGLTIWHRRSRQIEPATATATRPRHRGPATTTPARAAHATPAGQTC